MDFKDVIYEKADGVATITINRPEKLNAFRLETLRELSEAFRMVETDGDVGVAVLTGAGDRAFCAGGDVEVEDTFDASLDQHWGRASIELAMTMRSCGKPVIARVKGWAIGGGNELQMLCDMTIASEDSKFGQAGPKMGSVPVWWGTQLLPRAVGDKRAKEVVMLCLHYTARESVEMGMINRAVPAEELDAAVDEWCQRLLSMSGQSLRVAKVSLNHESDELWASVLHGFQIMSLVRETDEFHEGTSAFVEKRPPEFAKFRPGAKAQA